MKVLVTGGGTGGHIYPALAIIEEIKSRHPDAEFLYVGTKKGLENEVIHKTGIPFQTIDVKGFNSKNTINKMHTVKKATWALKDSFGIVRRFKPDLVIGTGGYVAGPVVLAAALLGVKTAIHEQNVYPGKTNKILSKFVNRIYLSYAESTQYFKNKSKLVITGNPVRNAFESLDKKACRAELGIDPETFFVVSFGGSGGAKKINDTMLLVLNFFKNEKKVKLIHVTGKSYYEKFVKSIDQAGFQLGSNASVKDYIFDIPKYICAADLVIGRAGATSLAELLAVRTPSILIPSPNVADDHQTYNALEMKRMGVSMMIKESELIDTKISQFIVECLENSDRLKEMEKAFESLPNAKAADEIVKDFLLLL